MRHMKHTTDICFVPPKMPDIVRPYCQEVMRGAPRGRDGEFCSEYMRHQLDGFPWAAHNLEKPELKVFCRWGMAVAKAGLSRNGKRKAKTLCPTVPNEVKEEVIREVEATIGKINDSFLGSLKFEEICYKYQQKYGITVAMFAEILVSKRKRTPSCAPGKVYAYRPWPNSKSTTYKLGFTAKDAEIRMHQTTRTTQSDEAPELLGWFVGTKSDETEILKLTKEFRPRDGAKEMRMFPDPSVIINIMHERVGSVGGKIKEVGNVTSHNGL